MIHSTSMGTTKPRKCPFCGSPRSTRSPSGEHLLCLGCQRIIIVPRKEAPKEEDSEANAKGKQEESSDSRVSAFDGPANAPRQGPRRG